MQHSRALALSLSFEKWNSATIKKRLSSVLSFRFAEGDLGRSARPCHQLPDILPKTAAIECIELVLAKLGIRLDDKVINFASRLCHRLPNYRNR